MHAHRGLRRRLAVLIPAVLTTVGVAIGLAAEPTGLTVEEVAPGTYAVIQPEAGRFNQSNSLFVVGERDVLAVDTQSTLEATRKVIEEIRRHTDRPVRHLVLTHWHGDHVQGVEAYREAWPDVEVIGHASLAEDILQRAQPQLDEDITLYEQALTDAQDRLERRVDRAGDSLDDAGVEALAGQIERGESTLAGMTSLPRPLGVPDLTYAQEVSLGGDVRLLHRTAHTRGDTLVYLPTVGVLATGDVLDDLPFGGHGYPRTWLRTLEELEELDFEVIVPGHGRVRRGKDHLRLVRDMYRSMLEQVNAAVSRELKLEATQKEVDLSRFRETLVADDAVAEQAWEAFIPATIERAWLEARDELPTDAR